MRASGLTSVKIVGWKKEPLREVAVAGRLAADDEVGLVASDRGVGRDALDRLSLMTGPTSVLLVQAVAEDQLRHALAGADGRSRRGSARCTISREAAVQRWPEVPNADHTTLSSARSRSASSQTTIGFLPPSSRLTRFSVSAARRADLDAGVGVAGEADDLDVGMVDDGIADLAAGAGDDVDDAVGQPALDEQLDEADEAGRRVARPA